MAVLYISEADAIRDIALLIAKVKAGTEVVIENGDSTVAVIAPPGHQLEEPEPGYDEWFRAEVQSVLDRQPAERMTEEQVEAIFAEKKRLTRLQLEGHTG